MQMKNIVFKTIFLTLAVVIVLTISIFGIASLTVPAFMTDFTASLGLTEISGDYAFQEYERSGEVTYLVRSFLVAAHAERYELADERYGFIEKVDEEELTESCEEIDENSDLHEAIEGFTCKNYVYGNAAVTKYHLAKTDDARTAALTLAIQKTEHGFPQGNPVLILAVDVSARKDEAFSREMVQKMQAAGFEENKRYQDIIKLLEEVYV